MKKFLALLGLCALTLTACGERDTTYDAFTQCLADEGVEYYGAFWCPNCQNQKKDFGDSGDILPYTECDPNGKDANPQACRQAGIESYPTWIFQDGTRLIGRQDLETLSEYSSCPLPSDSVMYQ